MTKERHTPSPPRLLHSDEEVAALFTSVESELRSGIDEASAWRRLQPRLQGSLTNAPPTVSTRARYSFLAAVAAGLMLGWFGWRLVQPSLLRPTASTLQPMPSMQNNSSIRLAAGKSKLPDGTIVELAAGAQGTYKTERSRSTLEFDRGRLDVAVAAQPPERPFVVKAQDYEFVVLGTRFSVNVVGSQVDLAVTEGRVAVQTAAKRLRIVAAGDHWSSRDESPVIDSTAVEPPAVPSSRNPLPSPEPKSVGSAAQLAAPNDPATCRDLLRDGIPGKAETCYSAIAAGSGLSAEMALYEVARLRRDVLADPNGALLALDEYESRFASGTLAPEVRMARVDLLARLGRSEQALQASGRLLESPLGRSRAVELRLLRGNLLRDKQHDCTAAIAEYQHIERDPGPRGDQAQWSHARCLEQLGRIDEAIQIYRSYLGRPDAQQAERARARLQELRP